jgi:hypothetical protein
MQTNNFDSESGVKTEQQLKINIGKLVVFYFPKKNTAIYL